MLSSPDSSNRNRSRLKAGDRRDQLLDVLVQVIRTEGFEQVTMARLAEAAEVNPSLLMHHFGNKEKLMLALVERTLQRYRQLFSEMPTQGSARGRLVRVLGLMFGQRWMATLHAPELFAMLSIARRNPDVAQAVGRMYRGFHRVLTQELTLQQNEGTVRIAEPQQTARMLMALIEGGHYFSEQVCADGRADAQYQQQLVIHALQMLAAGPLTREEIIMLENDSLTQEEALHAKH
jgi:AcrR family transcriptional regulator